MTKKNAAASVKQRLLNLHRKTGEDFQLLLTRYAVERLLYRLAGSAHAQAFVLKGAMLFALWTGKLHRPTRDLDLLGFGGSDDERLTEVFRSLCRVEDPDDGLEFDDESVAVEPIREEQEYGGKRVTLRARLGQARVDLQVDVGFGDAVTPGPEVVDYPTLLGMAAPRLRAYPRETAVAEKAEAMVKLALANSRMKDFYDLVVLARQFPFDGERLRTAVAATFARRGTPLPSVPPTALTERFAADDTKLKQWRAFRARSGLSDQPEELGDVVQVLGEFLLPVLSAAGRNEPFRSSWRPGGPWLPDSTKGPKKNEGG